MGTTCGPSTCSGSLLPKRADSRQLRGAEPCESANAAHPAPRRPPAIGPSIVRSGSPGAHGPAAPARPGPLQPRALPPPPALRPPRRAPAALPSLPPARPPSLPSAALAAPRRSPPPPRNSRATEGGTAPPAARRAGPGRAGREGTEQSEHRGAAAGRARRAATRQPWGGRDGQAAGDSGRRTPPAAAAGSGGRTAARPPLAVPYLGADGRTPPAPNSTLFAPVPPERRPLTPEPDGHRGRK